MKKKETKLFKYKNFILIIAIFVIVSFMTIGFSLYGQEFIVAGNTSLEPDGILMVTDFTPVTTMNATHKSISYVGKKLNLEVEFGGDTELKDGTKEFYIIYSVSLTNMSVYDYTYNTFNFNGSVTSSSGSTGTMTFTIDGIESGDIIKSGESRTLAVRIDFVPSDDSKTYTTTTETDVDVNKQKKGSIHASIATVTNDLSGSNDLAQFTLSVINTYEDAVSFTVNSSSSNFVFVDSSGNDLGTLTIPASTTQDYTVYLTKTSDAVFADTTETSIVTLKCTDLGNVTVGSISLLVDKSEVTDTTIPIIDTITFAMDMDTVGKANLSWTAHDTVGSIVSYSVNLYNTSGLVNTYTTSLTEYTFSDLAEGSYYVKIYATDSFGNTGSGYLNSASTSSGYCMQSATVAMKWMYSVDTSGLKYMTMNGETTAKINSAYSVTLVADDDYYLASSLTITMAGQTLTSGTDYSYDGGSSGSGALTINNVTGDITISGTGTEIPFCLVEGSLITLADGTKKPIEDIRYDDLLLVYDFVNDEFTYEYPIWIEKGKHTKHYQLTTFSDGTVLKTVGSHAVFSLEAESFVDISDRNSVDIGTKLLKVDEDNNLYEAVVDNIEIIYEDTNYYHIVSTQFYNVVANDVFTSDGRVELCNYYLFNTNIIDNKISITWGDRYQYSIENNIKSSYSDIDYADYYLYKGLHAEDEAVLVHYGYLTREQFKFVFVGMLQNEDMRLYPNTNIFGNRMWMVTTSEDVIYNNKSLYMYEESSYYTLPQSENKNFVGWYNTSDMKMYSANDKVQIWHGTYFKAIYK